MLSHSLKTTGSVSQFVWKTIIKNQQSQRLHCQHAITSDQSLPRIIQRSAVKYYCSSSKNDDSDDHMQSSNIANQKLISNLSTTSNFNSEQDLLLYLDQQLKTNRSDDIVLTEKYLLDPHSLPSHIVGSRSYQKVLEAWCKIRNFDRAELLLNQIHQNYVNKKCKVVAPDRQQFRKVLVGYQIILTKEATIGKNHEYATKIEKLIQKMKEWHEQFGYNTKPVYVEYDILFQTMAYSDKPDSRKADEMFRDLMKQYDDGDVRLKLTTDLFRNVLCLWDLSQPKDTLNPTDVVHHSMALYNEAKNRSIPFDSFCYHRVISILCRFQQYERAESLYSEMIRLYKGGDESMKPRKKTLATVLHVRSKTGDPIGAQEVFTEMLKEWKLGNVNYKPTIQHFTLLLIGWYNSGKSDAADIAHDWVRKLNQITNDVSLRPDIFCYTLVLKCYNRSNHLDAWKHVVDLYEEVKTQKNVKLNLVFYLELLGILIKVSTNLKKNFVGKDIVNDDNHFVAIVDMIKQILTKDVYDVPDSIWQQQLGGGVWFCNSVNDMLTKYKAPYLKEISSHVETNLRPKTLQCNHMIAITKRK